MAKIQPCPYRATSACVLPWGHLGPCQSSAEARLAEQEAVATTIANAYAGCKARLAEARLLLIRLTNEVSGSSGLYGVREAIGNTNMACLELRVSEAREWLRATDSATACLGGAPHWWDINANTGLPECRLCHKSPDPSAKESL